MPPQRRSHADGYEMLTAQEWAPETIRGQPALFDNCRSGNLDTESG